MGIGGIDSMRISTLKHSLSGLFLLFCLFPSVVNAGQVVMCWLPSVGRVKEAQRVLMVAHLNNEKIRDKEAKGFAGYLEVTRPSQISKSGDVTDKMQIFMNPRHQDEFDQYQVTLETADALGAYAMYIPYEVIGKSQMNFQALIKYSDMNGSIAPNAQTGECVSILLSH